jgi:hypothetical protein
VSTITTEQHITIGQLATVATLLQQILDELRKGDNWTGSGRSRWEQTGANTFEVPSAAADTKIIGGNAYRQQLIIFNASTAILYLKYGRESSLTSYTVQIAAGASWTVTGYTGPLYGTWVAANGFALVTEF